MKKLVTILILVVGFNASYSQCTPFLGGDKTICVGDAPVIYNNLYFTNATFVATVLTPTDTIKGTGGAVDNVLLWATKTKLVATLPNGCKDSSILRVRNRVYPIPDLGRDTILNLSVQQEFTSILSFADGITFISGYNNHNWNTPTPTNVDTGKYLLTVVTHDGCADDIVITVACARKKDTVVRKCVGPNKYDLTKLFVKSGYSNLWKTIRYSEKDTVLTPNPAAVDTGSYLLFTSKAGRCTDTVFVRVDTFPRLNLGPDRNVVKCIGSTTDITKQFTLTGLTTLWSTADPYLAPVGNHRLIATNENGCKDTVFVNVRDTTRPYIGPDASTIECSSIGVNMESNFTLTGLIAQWTSPSPTSETNSGIYRVIGTNTFGCTDTALFTILHYLPPEIFKDTVVKICVGKARDLNTIYKNLPAGFSIVDWSPATDPAAVGEGNYIATLNDNTEGCQYTAVVTVEVAGEVPPSLTLCTYQSPAVTTFTTNNFSTILVDKRGFVWAGTIGGGLYRFSALGNTCAGTWEQFNPTNSANLIQNSYRDIYNSTLTGDSSIWLASQGYGGINNLNGGVDRLSNFNSPVQHFGSVLIPNSGELSSRNGFSLAIGSSHKLYVALGQTRDNTLLRDTILEGGIYQYDPVAAPVNFTKPAINIPTEDVQIFAAGKRGDDIWFAVDRSCSSGCSNPYIVKWNDMLNAPAGFVDETNSPLPFTDQSLIIRTIFTATDGRTYVGMNTGNGIGVLDAETPGGPTPEWTIVSPFNSPLPVGASINFNAITEVNGEIWIGTTAGLLVYDGVGPLSECTSYKLYTTAQGLPSNNVTDIAYNNISFDVWLATNNGVCKITINHAITGNVLNVSAGKYDDLVSPLKTYPIENSLVELIQTSGAQAGQMVDFTHTNANGSFEFTNVKPATTYQVKVNYLSPHGPLRLYNYTFSNLNFNSLLGDILIPDSLSIELDTLKIKLEKYRFEFEQWGIKIDTIFALDQFLRVADGYITTNHNQPFLYYNTNEIASNHRKRIENAANYYTALATIYSMGLMATELKADQYSLFLDATKAVVSVCKVADKLKKIMPSFGGNKKEDEEESPTKDLIIEKLTASINNSLNTILESVTDLEWKKTITEIKPLLNASIEIMVSILDKGLKETFFDEALKIFEKAFLIQLAKRDYTDYCTVLHKDLVLKLAQQATDLVSDLKYTTDYKNVYNLQLTNPSSLHRQAKDTTAFFKKEAKDWKDNSEITETIGTGLDVAAELAPVVGLVAGFFAGGVGAIPGLGIGIEVAAALQKVKTVMEVLNVGFLFKGAYEAWNGNREVRKISTYVKNKSGFNSYKPSKQNQAFVASVTLDSLEARKIRYNVKINELNAIHALPYDSAAYYTKFNQFVAIDKLYQAELKNVLDQLWPKAAPAIQNIPSFYNKFNYAIDSLVQNEMNLMASFGITSYSYQSNPYQIGIVSNLDLLKNKIVTLNNNAVIAIQELFSLINTNGIQTGAYLQTVRKTLQFDNQWGSTATVTYTLNNTGNVVQTNVGFLMGQPEGGFTLTSPAFVSIGDLLPGQTKQLSYTFTAPNRDTIGSYYIQAFADNGVYNNIAGYLFTNAGTDFISKATGLWSDAATWSSGRIPTTTSDVIIRHNVTVNVDATVKSLKAQSPAQVTVAAGKKLTILQ